jgi:hypothetical protein
MPVPLPTAFTCSSACCPALAESKQLAELQDLFELYVSDYLQLQRCSEELLVLKALWDSVGAVMYQFAEWWVPEAGSGQ